MTKPPMYHIYPIDVKGPKGELFTSHCTDESGMCGCKPEHRQCCPEANENSECEKDCFRCGGTALVPVYDPAYCVIVVHNDALGPVYPRLPNSKLRCK